MKRFAHPGANEKVPSDLNAAIESTVTVACNEWKYVADLDLDPDLPPVSCLVGDINEVVLNMIINATHAIQEKLGEGGGEKGRRTISTRTEEGTAVIRIRDTGAGIPEHLQGRIFDLFSPPRAWAKAPGRAWPSVTTSSMKGTAVRLPAIAKSVPAPRSQNTSAN